MKIILVLLLLAIVGCARGPVHKPTQALPDRVEILMNARIAGSWGVVYDLSDSNFKKSTPRDQFLMRKRGVKTKNFKLLGIEYLGDTKAKVSVSSDIDVSTFAFTVKEETQEWILERDGWMYVMPKVDQKFGF